MKTYKEIYQEVSNQDKSLLSYDLTHIVSFKHCDKSEATYYHALLEVRENGQWYVIFTEHHGFFVYHFEDLLWINVDGKIVYQNNDNALEAIKEGLNGLSGLNECLYYAKGKIELKETKVVVNKIDEIKEFTPLEREVRLIKRCKALTNIKLEQDLRILWGDLLIENLLEIMEFEALLKWIHEPCEYFDNRTPSNVARVDGSDCIWDCIDELRKNKEI